MMKRLLDLISAAAGVLLLWPLGLVIAIAIRLDGPGPILFRQIRVGRRGRPFWILKFRTMTPDAAQIGPCLTRREDSRVTRVGGLLRHWKLDELPQLINVLRGEMSLVGPRPELRRYVRMFADEYRDILAVRPGLTDFASIAYRHESDRLQACDDPEEAYVRHILPDKLRLAREYVRRASLGYDLWLVLRTLFALCQPAPREDEQDVLERHGRRHRVLSTVVQALLCACAFLAAWGLRFDGALTPEAVRSALAALPFVVLVRSLWLRVFHLDRDVWQFVGIEELANLLASMTLATLTLALALVPRLPASILVIDALLAVAALAGVRLLRRMQRERGGRQLAPRRVLVIGANAATERILRDLSHQSQQPYRFVGLVGSGRSWPGTRVHGVPIVGAYDEIDTILETTAPDEVLMVASAVPDEQRRELARRCRAAERPVRIVPDVADLLSGAARSPAALQPDIGELMPRDPVIVDLQRLHESYAGRSVLVTGAGGSIGSEICRQLAACEPKLLVMFEKHERSLYDIERELRARHPRLPMLAVIGDIRDTARVQDVFERATPECVFHAAAYKHVPMMEHNPTEAFKTNVIGTRTLAEAADRGGVGMFVLISTDKAVEPVSVMGATKRMAELVLQRVARGSRTRFHTVRFGNVLESSGSVVPLFREQIERGGPVTVTHPDVTRWFMTVPEAVHLILEVRALGEGGEVFVLDMGRPMRVLDLARALIRQYGLRPDRDVPIVFTGLRAGERLFEKLFNDHEVVWKTSHPRILKAVDLTAHGNGTPGRPDEFRRLWRRIACAKSDVSSRELGRQDEERNGVMAGAGGA